MCSGGRTDVDAATLAARLREGGAAKVMRKERKGTCMVLQATRHGQVPLDLFCSRERAT